MGIDNGLEMVRRQTWLETVHHGNMKHRRVRPQPWYKEVLLGTDQPGRLKPVPPEIVRARPFHTGTLGVVGDPGKPLRKQMRTECDYHGMRKKVVFEPDPGQLRLEEDTVLFCDQGFAPSGKPLLDLLDSGSGMPIADEDGMLRADVVIVRFRGQARPFRINNRKGGLLEQVGDESVTIVVPDSAVVGLVSCGVYGGDYFRRFVYLYGWPSVRYTSILEPV